MQKHPTTLPAVFFRFRRIHNPGSVEHRPRHAEEFKTINPEPLEMTRPFGNGNAHADSP
jgi:hypothetical protein